MTGSFDAIVSSTLASIKAGEHNRLPYDYWILRNCLPENTIDEILTLPFPPPDLEGRSGKRELHNATRTYFDQPNQNRFPVVNAVSLAFQNQRMTSAIAKHFATDLRGTYLRIEFAQDIDGFWLEPHSDLGVKLFTMLLYVSKDESHAELGTDIYDNEKKPVGRTPFEPNSAMVFIPSGSTFHGFEQRKIDGVRKSIIINYVSDEWRAREQLAFPDQAIS